MIRIECLTLNRWNTCAEPLRRFGKFNFQIVFYACLFYSAAWVGAQEDEPEKNSLSDKSNSPRWALMRLEEHSGEDEWNGVYDLNFSPDDRFLAARTRDHKIQIYDLESTRLTSCLDGHAGFIKAMLFSEKNSQLLTVASGTDEFVKFWDYQTGELKRQLEGGGQHMALDQGQLSVVDNSKLFQTDLSTDQTQQKRLQFAGEQILGMTNDASTFAVVRTIQRSRDPSPIRIVNHLNKDEVLLDGLQSQVKKVAFSSNQRFAVALYQRENTAVLWDLNDHCKRFDLGQHSERVESVAFSPDNRLVATCSWDRTIRIRDILSGKTVAVLKGHLWNVCAVTFSNDGSRLASGATGRSDCSIIVWDIDKALLDHLQTETSAEPSDAIDDIEFWRMLGDANPHVALSAVRNLATNFGEREHFVRSQVTQTIKPIDHQAIQLLIYQLGSERYALRQRATQHLIKIRSQVEKVLRESLNTTKSVEIKFRIRSILAIPRKRLRLEQHSWFRWHRLIHALELANDGASRGLLKVIAIDHPHVEIAREARESLERLAEN